MSPHPHTSESNSPPPKTVHVPAELREFIIEIVSTALVNEMRGEIEHFETDGRVPQGNQP